MRWPPPSHWPHRAHSRQVFCKPHRWHVQEMGQGDLIVLLHGAGGSTHSFRHLMPLLAEHYRVVANAIYHADAVFTSQHLGD